MQLATHGQYTPALARRLNVWYSINDGNWSDPNTWMSTALDKKNVVSPRSGDNVYILHNVNFDVGATVNNLYIQQKLSSNVNGLTLNVLGDLQCNGILDFTSNNTNVFLYGTNNFINTFTAGNSTVSYFRQGDQNVMDLTYKNLTIGGLGGTKYLVNHLNLPGNLIVNGFLAGAASVLELGAFNLTVNGTTQTTFNNASGFSANNDVLHKSGAGTIIFVGSCNFNNNCTFTSTVTSMEFRGGFTGGPVGGSININCPVTFTTNSQTLSCNVIFNNTVTIVGAITVTGTNTNGMTFNGVVTGTVAGSTFTNNGKFITGTTTVPMGTGVFNYMNGGSSTMDYSFNGNYTLPYTTFNHLAIHGTGTKTLLGNTTCVNLNISDFSGNIEKLECSTFNLTINGNFSISELNGGALLKSGAGTIIFVGSASWNTQHIAYASNVTLEFRGGVTIGITGGAPTNTIDAVVNFTTANQTFNMGANSQVINGAVNIAAGITVNFIGSSTAGNQPILNGVLNGLSSTSIFQMGLNSTLIYNNATAPMVTGKLYGNQNTNTFIYGASGGQDITVPSDPTTPGYQNLTLQGSGAKRLLGNVSVKGVYTLTGPATLNSNGFALTNP